MLFIQHLMLMDMPQGHIGGGNGIQGNFVKGKMGGISSMQQKNFDPVVFPQGKTGDNIFSDFPVIVGKAVYLCINIPKIHTAYGIGRQIYYVFCPGKSGNGAVFPDTVMIACYNHHLGIGNGGEKKVHLL